MNDYWTIVLLFLDTKELTQLLKLNKSYKKYVSLFYFKQRLTITNRADFTEFLSHVSRVRYLRVKCSYEKKIMSYIEKLDSLQFLDLWSNHGFWNEKVRLPPNLIGLRIDCASDSPLNLLPAFAPQLQHLTLYCYPSIILDNLIHALSKFESLKCVHIYCGRKSDWLNFCQSGGNKFEFVIKMNIYDDKMLDESFICKHVTKKRKI